MKQMFILRLEVVPRSGRVIRSYRFPKIPDPEKWTHLGFSRKRVIKFRSND